MHGSNGSDGTNATSTDNTMLSIMNVSHHEVSLIFVTDHDTST